ncbi:MAG: hypothetical protein N2258_07490 [Brevinematales bacterium]|nr:hypothetical protein [Brevinematales bacterium]
MKRIFVYFIVMVLVSGWTFSATTTKKEDTKTTTKTETTKKDTKKTETKKEEKKESDGNLDSYFKPGTFAVNLGIGFAFFWGGFDIYPGIEYTFYQFKIDNKIPLDLGVAVRGVYYSWSTTAYGGNYGFMLFGAGAFATLHFGPKAIETLPEFLKRTDLYIGLGVRFFSASYTGDAAYLNSLGYTYGGVGVASLGGVSYFITDNFAINFEGSYYGTYGGGLIGVLYKF